MIIYNISFTIAPSFLEEWLHWSKEFLIPTIMDSKYFDNYKQLKVLTQEANQYPIYCLQFTTDSILRYTQYDTELSTIIKKQVSDKYKDQVLFFDSILKEID